MLQQTQSERVAVARLRQICTDLERRLGAGHACNAEAVFAEHPDLNSDADAALEVIYTEFVTREQLGQQPDAADFLKRFPQWQCDLAQLLEIHQVSASTDTVRSSRTPFRDDGRLQNLAEPSEEGIARRIGNYELLGEIGRGGMGVVHKARQIGLNRFVALKMILTGVDAGLQERARFRAEAEAAARLQHPNIVQIHEVGEHDGRPFLCLEYVDGVNLERLLTGEPWQATESARLIETLARAMHYAHQQGVVHRDLKPANVLLQIADCKLQSEAAENPAISNLQSAIPKITDFGLARRMPDGDTGADAKTGPTRSGAIVGTPAYMAPEQAAGDGGAIGPAADVHALGAILYEMLTARPPFQGATVLDTLEQVRSRDPLPPTRMLPGLPRDLETICLKCLEKEPGRRYASAAALADDLGRFQRGEPILARAAPAWEKAWKWARRRPVVAALLAAVVVVTITGLTSVTVLWQQTAAALVAMQKERDEKEAAFASKLVALAERDWLANDLQAARRHLDECPTAHRGVKWRHLHRVCHACLLVLTDTEVPGNVLAVAWSPDGRFLASNSRAAARVWDLQTGRPRFSLAYGTHQISRLAINPEGQLVSLSLPSSTVKASLMDVQTWDLENGREISAFKVTSPARAIPTLSANGRRIAYLRDGNLTLLDIPGAPAPTTLVAKSSQPFYQPLSPDGRMFAWRELKGTFVWDTQAGALAGPMLPVPVGNGLAFSPVAARLAAGRIEALTAIVSVWDYRTGQEILTLRAPKSGVSQWVTDISPDGRRLATSLGDNTIMVWDLDTGKELFTFRGHLSSVSVAAFSPDGARLASGSKDGTIRIWDVRPGDE